MKLFHIFAATVALGAGVALLPVSSGAKILSMQSSTLSPKEDGREIRIETQNGILSVTPVTADIFRVGMLPTGSKTALPVSKSAILKPVNLGDKLRMTATRDGVTISSPTTTLKINRRTGKVSFYDSEGKLLLSEADGVVNSGKDTRVTFTPAVKSGEFYYGAGERAHSLMLNGDTLQMYNRPTYGYGAGDSRISQMNITVPYFISSRGYGVLFDDHTKSTLVLGDTISYEAPLATGALSYYFINGGSIAGTTERYMELTGRQELPPFWALGYITSKYGYHSQKETLGAIDSLKTRGYPVDGIVLDLYWYGTETDMGRLDWDKNNWPDPEGMLATLKHEGVNLIPITQPYLNKKGAIDNYNYLVERKMTVRDEEGNNHDVTTWVGDAGMIDVSNPQTREWYWNRYRDLTNQGVAGWWGDLGEPEVHPATIRHYNGMTAEQYHNLYGNEWSRIIYDGFKEEFPDKRLMLLMRGGTAGLQRYNVFPWSGDVSRSWAGLQPQVNIMLNTGLSGLAYMSSDIGGFAVDPAHPTDSELYLRWLQMGTFTPSLRTHAQLKPEPYHYPEIEAQTKKFIKMRYEWLPYNYTLSYENATLGYPLVRPLNFRGDNPDKKYANVTDEYLWGDNVLIAPVMQAKARSRKVLFPAGTWVNYNNDRLTYKGGTTATVSAPLDELPMFVKQGTFLPLYPIGIENVTQYDLAHLRVLYYPSTTPTSYTLFDDDRISTSSLTDGNFILTTFTGEKKGTKINVSISSDKNPGVHDWMPNARNIELVIKCMHSAPRSVSIGGQMLKKGSWSYNASTRSLSIPLVFDGEPLNVDVVL